MLALLLAVLTTSPPLHAQRTSAKLTIDGRLDEAAWAAAEPVSDLRQLQPDEGAPPSERTEVRVLYDDSALYVAFTCFDSQPGRIVTRLARRDEDAQADDVELELDTRGDHSSAFHFGVSAANVQRDAIRTGDDAYDFAWDAVWTSAVTLGEHGWVAELRIPFAELRFDAGAEGGWRVQLGRAIARKNEKLLWAFKSRAEFGAIARFRPLEGLLGLPQPHGFFARPFALLAVQRGDGTGLSPRLSAGLDLRYALGSSLSFDLTALPDFGQVEADPALLNLSTFETLYPERRPFFVESAPLYQLHDAFGERTGAQLFYSRRIGAGGAPIWQATKLSGRVGETVSLGLLDAATAETADAPLSNFAVARASAALGHGLTLGGMVTDVRRQVPALARDVTAAEAELGWAGFDGEWLAQGHVMGSRVNGGPERVLRDGTLVKAGDLGFGARVEVAHPAGLVFGRALFETYSPALTLDEAGHLQRANLHRLFVQLGVQLFDRGPFQQSKTALEVFGRNAWDGAVILRGANLNNFTQWNNFWSTWLELQWNGVGYENRELGDGTRFERPALWGLEWSLDTNPSRPISAGTSGVAHLTRIGLDVDCGAYLSANPIDRLRLSLEPSLRRVTGDVRHVETLGPGEYRFGLQEALGAGLTLRSTLTFTPRLTLQLYAQLFFADVQYRELYEATERAGGTVVLAALRDVAIDPRGYAERLVSLNVNVVFRWEYLPGSVLYLVYTRGQGGTPEYEDARGRPRIDLAGLGRVPAQDVLMVKLAYYFAG